MDKCQKNPLQKFINYFFSLNAYELTLLADILGFILAAPLSNEQQNSLGNWLELLGQQIEAIQAQGALQSPQAMNQNQLNDILNKINFRFEYLEELLNYIKEKNDGNL